MVAQGSRFYPVHARHDPAGDHGLHRRRRDCGWCLAHRAHGCWLKESRRRLLRHARCSSRPTVGRRHLYEPLVATTEVGVVELWPSLVHQGHGGQSRNSSPRRTETSSTTITNSTPASAKYTGAIRPPSAYQRSTALKAKALPTANTTISSAPVPRRAASSSVSNHGRK